jgi:hypothetical protein
MIYKVVIFFAGFMLVLPVIQVAQFSIEVSTFKNTRLDFTYSMKVDDIRIIREDIHSTKQVYFEHSDF